MAPHRKWLSKFNSSLTLGQYSFKITSMNQTYNCYKIYLRPTWYPEKNYWNDKLVGYLNLNLLFVSFNKTLKTLNLSDLNLKIKNP